MFANGFHLHRRAGKRFSSSVDRNPDTAIPADPDRRWHSFTALSMASQAPLQLRINGRNRTGGGHASCRQKLIFLSGNRKSKLFFCGILPCRLVRRASQTSGVIPASHFRGRKGGPPCEFCCSELLLINELRTSRQTCLVRIAPRPILYIITAIQLMPSKNTWI